MRVVENYLLYLNSPKEIITEANVVTKAFGFLKQNAKEGAVGSLQFTAFINATILALTAGKFIISRAERKCGLIGNSPGKKLCVANERIKGLKQQLAALQRMRGACSKTKDPQDCMAKIERKMKPIRVSIKMNQYKIDDIEKSMNESELFNYNMDYMILQETDFISELSAKSIGKIAVGVTGFGTAVAAGMMMDKAVFLAQRTLQSWVNSAVKKCGTYKTGPERDLCMSKIKLTAFLKEKKILSNLISKCEKKSKDPNKCREKFQKRMEKLDIRIKIQSDNIRVYTKQMEMENKR